MSAASAPAASCGHEAREDAVLCAGVVARAPCTVSACVACAADGAQLDDARNGGSNPYRIDIEPFAQCFGCKKHFCGSCADSFWGCHAPACDRTFCDACFCSGAITHCDKCFRGYCFDSYPKCCWHGGFCDNCSVHLCMKAGCDQYVDYCSVDGCFRSGCSKCCIISGCETCSESFCPDHADLTSCDVCYASYCFDCEHVCEGRRQ